MASRVLQSPPALLPLYARTAASLLPGASLLPLVPGGGGDMPQIELELAPARASDDRIAAYARVCGFQQSEAMPPTFPHVLAFPLHIAVMADGRFPFGAVGLVHISNRIVQHRPIACDEALAIKVRPRGVFAHPKGSAFTLLTEVSSSGELVWEGESTMLHRGKAPSTGTSQASTGTSHASNGISQASNGTSQAANGPSQAANGPSQASSQRARSSPAATPPTQSASTGSADARAFTPIDTWQLPRDLGRRYGAVSGDRNPIHIHPLSAKLLGFPSAIAHGMWTKARCLAALQPQLPQAFTVEVDFRKPILLPAEAQLAVAQDGEATQLQVRDPRRQTIHLEGRISR